MAILGVAFSTNKGVRILQALVSQQSHILSMKIMFFLGAGEYTFYCKNRWICVNLH